MRRCAGGGTDADSAGIVKQKKDRSLVVLVLCYLQDVGGTGLRLGNPGVDILLQNVGGPLDA